MGSAEALALRGKQGPVDLVAAILTGSADLRGAACAGMGRLFDPDVAHAELGYPDQIARESAVEATCVGCPVRAQCWAWASRLPSLRVTGPTAASSSVGLVMRARKPGRPRTEAPYRPRKSVTEPPTPEDPEPEIPRPGPARRRGARRRVKPSINRKRRRYHR